MNGTDNYGNEGGSDNGGIDGSECDIDIGGGGEKVDNNGFYNGGDVGVIMAKDGRFHNGGDGGIGNGDNDAECSNGRHNGISMGILTIRQAHM